MTSKQKSRSHLNVVFLAASSALALAAFSPQKASADTVSVRVGGAVDAGVHVSIDGGIDVVGVIDAGLSFGIGFSEPPPPPPPAPPVPSYYVVYEEPVYAPPAPPAQPYVVKQARAFEPAIKRWGIGAFAGSVRVGEQESGSDVGILGRYRLSPTWSVEGELTKTQTSDSERVDRRLGGAIHWHLPVGKRLRPSLLVGGGYGQSEFGKGELHAQQGYGEVGLALQYEVSRSFHIIGDVRAGTRTTNDDVMHIAKGGQSVDLSVEEEEDYSRARLGAMIFF